MMTKKKFLNQFSKLNLPLHGVRLPEFEILDKDKRKATLSIKALEEQQTKEAVKKYGSTDSGALLGEILGPLLKNKKKKDKK